MPYDKSKPYSCPCCGYWNYDMEYDYYKHKQPRIEDETIEELCGAPEPLEPTFVDMDERIRDKEEK